MRIVGDGLWDEIRTIAKNKGAKLAAVAYVTSDEIVKFTSGDTLVTDASDEAIMAGRTSAAVLRAACMRGARLFSYPGLHAKVYAFGRTVIVGSANLSTSSSTQLFEAAVITEGARAVAGVNFLIESLKSQADVIDGSFLERIERLPVRQSWRPRRKHTRSTRAREANFWFVGAHELSDDARHRLGSLSREVQVCARSSSRRFDHSRVASETRGQTRPRVRAGADPST